MLGLVLVDLVEEFFGLVFYVEVGILLGFVVC